MMEDTEIFAIKITQLRKRLGWSRVILSERTNIPYHTLKQWETGIAKPAPYVQKMFVVNINALIKSMYEESIKE